MRRLFSSSKAPWHRFAVFAAIVALVILGLLLRIPFMPNEGYLMDVRVIASWGRFMTMFGWTDAYRHALYGLSAANYPPGNMAIIALMTRIHDALGGSLQPGGWFENVMMKTPAVLADAWLSLVLYALVRRFASQRIAIGAGAAYWLHPGVWLLSAVWGQTDGIYSAFAFASLAAIAIGMPLLGGALFALSLTLKVQAILVAPAALILLLRRPRFIGAFIVGFLPILLIFLPFALEGQMHKVFGVYTKAPGLPAVTSFFTYNFWWGIFGLRARVLQDTILLFDGFSYRTLGLSLTVLCYAFLGWRLWRAVTGVSEARARLLSGLAAASLMTIAFCFFMTRVQQRYVMPFVPCAIALIFLTPIGRKHLVFLLFSFAFNVASFMFAHRIGISMQMSGKIGFVFAWANAFVAADLAALWWATLLAPSSRSSTFLQTVHGFMSRIAKGEGFYGIVVTAVAAGVIVRVVELSGSGFFLDVYHVSKWAILMHERSWTSAYETGANYPPINMAILGAMANLHDMLGGASTPLLKSLNVMIKIPATLADAWLSVLVYAVLAMFTSRRVAIMGALACWLCPYLWLISAYWGQTDSIYVSLAIGSLLGAVLGFPVLAGILFAFALLSKFQAIIVAPVIALILFRQKRGALLALASACTVTILVLIPFVVAGSADAVFTIIGHGDIRGLLPIVGYKSYNIWWGFLASDAIRIKDAVHLFGPLTYRHVGFVLTSFAYGCILWRFRDVLLSDANRKRIMEASLAAIVLTSFAFFLFMTRMHVRYVFFFVPPALMLCFLRPEGRAHLIFLLSSLCFNLVTTIYFPRSQDSWLSFGVVLSWVNVGIAVHLTVRWWNTLLRPERVRWA